MENVSAARLTDKANCPSDSHGDLCCPHNTIGPSVEGSDNVLINSLGGLRVGDSGIHSDSKCCGSNTWHCSEGSSSVFINGKSAVRKGDKTTHCGGTGTIIQGSNNVFIGG